MTQLSIDAVLDKIQKGAVGTGPLPLIEVPHYSTGYWLRIATDDPKPFIDWLTASDIEYWFLVREWSKREKPHLHITILDPEPDKKWFVATLQDSFPWCKGGDKFNCQLIKDVQKCCSYSLKDGDEPNHWYYGFGDKFIAHCKAISRKKFSKDTFMIRFQKIKDIFLLSAECNDYSQFLVNWIKLKCEYEQSINWSYMENYATMLACKKGGEDRIVNFVQEKLDAKLRLF